jgi:hypothetical protein
VVGRVEQDRESAARRRCLAFRTLLFDIAIFGNRVFAQGYIRVMKRDVPRLLRDRR